MKNIELSIKLFVKEIEKVIEEREEYEVLNFNECINHALEVLKEYFEEQGLNVNEEMEWILCELGYYMLNESTPYSREVYIEFELLDI